MRTYTEVTVYFYGPSTADVLFAAIFFTIMGLGFYAAELWFRAAAMTKALEVLPR